MPIGTGQLRRWRLWAISAVLIIAAAFLGVSSNLTPEQAMSVSGYINTGPRERSPDWPPNTESPKVVTGSIRGSVIDEEGQPVRELEIELIQADKSGDSEWTGRQSAWSDKSGEYEFKSVSPGEYLVGVHINEAPDGEHPFETTYYPGVRDRLYAQRVYVAAGDATSLTWMRLRKIEVVSIPINLYWLDGQPTERGNLLFNNLSYPDSGPVGGFAPQIDNGEGNIVLPVGFEYIARAKVDCDAGSKIETIESRPIQRFEVRPSEHPEKLAFVIPATRCQLWRPAP